MQILMQPMGRTLRPGMRVSGGLTTIFQLATLDLRFAQQKTLDPRITFTRASSGTYVGSDGVLRTATTNLLLRSEELDNASWTKQTSVSVTANQTTSPDGATTADLITWTSASTNTGIYQNVFGLAASVACVRSVWIRADAAGGTVGLADSVFTSVETTVTLTTSWQRVQVVQNTSSGGAAGLWVRKKADSPNTIYLWGAQLEQSSTVGEYIPTTSVINSAPRFDHNPTTGESLGLLVEEQRTNSIRNNTMVGAVAGTPGTAPTNWSSDVPGLTREIVGTGTEAGVSYIDIRLSGTTSNTYGNIFFETNSAITASNGQAWAHSLWLRIVGGSLSNISTIRQAFDQFGSSGATYLSTITSTLTGASSSWVRYIASLTTNNASVDRVRPSLSLLWSNGSAIDITLRIGFPQLEQGAFATSVIPTTTATVTRSADVPSITGTNFSSWYRQDEGTVFGDVFSATAAANANIPAILSFDDGTGNNRTQIYRNNNNGSPNLGFVVVSGGSLSALLAARSTQAQPGKIAGAYKASDFAVSADGLASLTDASGSVSSCTQAQIGNGTSLQPFTGTIRRLTYWPQRLSNSTLQEVTR